jgi:RHS repeat-associated protein
LGITSLVVGSILLLFPDAEALGEVSPRGAYQTAIQLEVPAYHGLQPDIKLIYDSDLGSSILGVGWRLSGLSEILRLSPGKGSPRYDNQDIYVRDGMELIRCTSKMRSPSCMHPPRGNRLRIASFTSRIESFERIAFESPSITGRWIVWRKNGIKSTYTVAEETVSKRLPSSRWKLSTVEDRSGNIVRYQYSTFDADGEFGAESYLTSIAYNGVQITFYYEARPDPVTYAGNGGVVIQKRRLKSIDIIVGTDRARTYALEYDPAVTPLAGLHSRLIAIKKYGADAAVSSDGSVIGTTLPLTNVTYSTAPAAGWTVNPSVVGQQPVPGAPPASLFADVEVHDVRVGSGSSTTPRPGPIVIGDVNGDGRTDWVSVGFTGARGENLSIVSVLANTPNPVVRRTEQPFVPDTAWVPWDRLSIYVWALDMNGDGRTDLMIGIGYEPSASPIDEQVALIPAISVGDGSFAIGNSMRTSIIHLVGTGRPPGDNDPHPPACRVGDFDGNGLMDLACHYERANQTIKAEESFLTMVLSRPDGTFAISDAKLPFHDNGGVRSVAAADIDRDGRSDLVFIDPRGADLDSRAAGNTDTPIHYDIVTALSRGGDASTFFFARKETDWVYLSNPVGGPELALADIDGDGRPDVLGFTYAANGDYPASILTGRYGSDGTLTLNEEPVPAALQAGEHILTVGDFDGDGLADLLVASKHDPGSGTGCSNNASTADIVLNRVSSNGEGTFSLPSTWIDCSVARQVALEWNSELRSQQMYAADTNGDGLADFLLAANSVRDQTSVVLRDDVSASTGLDTYHWIAADISGKGHRDYVYVQPLGPQTVVHTVVAQPNPSIAEYQLSPDLYGWGRQVMRGWKVMDVNGDGRADLVYIHSAGTSTTGTSLIDVEVLFSMGNGNWHQAFAQEFTWQGALDDTTLLIPADVNGDGRTDLIALMNGAGSTGSATGMWVQTLIAQGDPQAPFSTGFVLSFTAAPPQGPFAVPGQDTATWRAVDVNGDGRTDLLHLSNAGNKLTITSLIAQGDGTWTMVRGSVPQTSDEKWDGVSTDDVLAWRTADLNSDGKIDLVHFAATSTGLRIHTLLSAGDGTHWVQSPQDIAFPGIDPFQLSDRMSWRVADVNGDGRADFVFLRSTPTGPRLDTLISTGDGFFSLSCEPLGASGAPSCETLGAPGVSVPLSSTWQIADVNADGRADLTRIDAVPVAGSGSRQIQITSLSSLHSDERLASISTEFGGSTEVSYVPAAAYDPSEPLSGCWLANGTSLQVVARTVVKDGRGVSDTTEFQYWCPKWSPYHRSLLGWKDIIGSTGATVNRPERSILRRYLLTDECLAQGQEVAYLDAFAQYVGHRGTSVYAPPQTDFPPYQCLVSSHTTDEYGLSAQWLTSAINYTYDDLGNPRIIDGEGSISLKGDETRVTQSYKYSYSNWLVGLPWQQVTTDPAQPNSLLRSTFFCYDGDNGTDFQNCDGIPVKGLLTAVQRVDDRGFYVTDTFLHDAFGNVSVRQNARHFGMQAFRDSTYHKFPTFVVNALGYTTALEWDTALEKITKATDPNGVQTTTKYDPLGRVYEIQLPGGPTVHRQYLNWGDPQQQHVHEYADDGSPDGLWLDTYYDGLARVYKIVKKGETPNNTLIRQYTYNDGSALVYTVSDWFSSEDSVSPVETFAYDENGRVVRQTHADGMMLSILHDSNPNGTVQTLTNERGFRKTIEFDAYGRLTSVTEMDQETGQTATVRYSYDAAGHLITVTDANGNITTNTWDILGRLRKVDSPDLGLRTATYDLTGNLETRTDARNHTTTFMYDGLNRPITKKYSNNQLITWNYDETGHGAGIGRLTSISDLSSNGCPQTHSAEYTYDEHGLVTTHVKCIDGLSYMTTLNRDVLARIGNITYPDLETVTYGYDTAGRVNSVSGYVDKIEYDPASRPLHIGFTNGTDAWLSYDPLRHWLDTSKVLDGSQSTIYDATYVHEGNALIKSVTSTTNINALNFTYDDLDRLRDVTGDLDQHFRYDPAGNITYNTSTNFYGAPASNYAYPAQGPTGCSVAGPCHPANAPTSAGLTQFQYDPNGNMSLVTNAQKQSKSIDWNDDQLPSVISEFNGALTSYTYDAGGERVSEQGTNGYTRYYGVLFDHSNAGLVKRYYAGPLLVAQKTGTTTYWIHNDHIGSVRVVTDSNGSVVARNDFAPFGGLLSTPSPAAIFYPSDFAGHVVDATGLVYMHARYYDPQLARFISPDTLIPNPFSTQAHNHYAYALNSPISFADPTGHQTEGISQEWAPDAGSFSFHIAYAPLQSQLMASPTQCSGCESLVTSVQQLPPSTTYPNEATNGPWVARNLDLEYVNVLVGPEAFGVTADQRFLLGHWYIETPQESFGIGPWGTVWGTDFNFTGRLKKELSGSQSINAIEITHHEGMGRDLTTGQLRPGWRELRVYGTAGFTERVNASAVYGSYAGDYGGPNTGTCQEFCVRVLGEAGAINIPSTSLERFTNPEYNIPSIPTGLPWWLESYFGYVRGVVDMVSGPHPQKNIIETIISVPQPQKW